jgi:hypothetical protein
VLLLGAGAGGALLTGCSLNNPFSSEKTPAAKAVRDLAPDVAVAVQAVALISAARAELESLIAAVPRYVDQLGGLADTYEAYEAALRGAVPKGVDATSTPTPTATPDPGTPSPTGSGDAGRAALRTATSLHAQLTGFALRAESGAFARLLGSMAAGLSQQLVVLR